MKTPKWIKDLTNWFVKKDIEIRLNRLNIVYKIFDKNIINGYKTYTVQYYIKSSTFTVSGNPKDIEHIVKETIERF